MRLKNKKNSKGLICKLIMNSLYGRFGMKIFVESTKFINYKELMKLKEKYKILNCVPLLKLDKEEKDIYMVTLKREPRSNKEAYALSVDTETAVQIASAITSYARIYMYDFKNIEGNKCYYSDTDSIFLEKELDSKYVGTELGKFKLEYKFKEGYFIAPKVYQIKFNNGISKTVFKGVRESELNKVISDNTFNEIVYNNKTIIVERKSDFIVNLLNLTVSRKEYLIKFNFEFKKREKVYNENNEWISTKSIRINRIKR